MAEKLTIFHVCKPRVFTTEGADHTGLDAYLKCPKCGLRTESHVECARVTDEVRGILASEWKAGRAALQKEQS